MCAGSLNRQRRQSALPSVFSRLQRGQVLRLASLTICESEIITPSLPCTCLCAGYSSRNMRTVMALLTVAWATACAHAPQAASPQFTLRSPAFAEGAHMPDNTMLNGLDCHGEN